MHMELRTFNVRWNYPVAALPHLLLLARAYLALAVVLIGVGCTRKPPLEPSASQPAPSTPEAPLPAPSFEADWTPTDAQAFAEALEDEATPGHINLSERPRSLAHACRVTAPCARDCGELFYRMNESFFDRYPDRCTVLRPESSDRRSLEHRVETYIRGLLPQVRSLLDGETRDRFDCAAGLLGLQEANDAACLRGDRVKALRCAYAVANWDAEDRQLPKAVCCGEIANCGLDCASDLRSIAMRDAASYIAYKFRPSCPDVERVMRNTNMDTAKSVFLTWAERRFETYLDALSRRVPADQRAYLACLRANVGKPEVCESHYEEPPKPRSYRTRKAAPWPELPVSDEALASTFVADIYASAAYAKHSGDPKDILSAFSRWCADIPLCAADCAYELRSYDKLPWMCASLGGDPTDTKQLEERTRSRLLAFFKLAQRSLPQGKTQVEKLACARARFESSRDEAQLCARVDVDAWLSEMRENRPPDDADAATAATVLCAELPLCSHGCGPELRLVAGATTYLFPPKDDSTRERLCPVLQRALPSVIAGEPHAGLEAKNWAQQQLTRTLDAAYDQLAELERKQVASLLKQYGIPLGRYLSE